MIVPLHGTRVWTVLGMGLFIVMLFVTASFAAYPDRAISLVVPYGVGGGTDLIGRVIARSMEAQFGQPVVVVNKTGAGGAVGFNYVARSEPDGYTVLLVALPIVTLAVFNDNPLTHKDLRPVALLNEDVAAILVRANAPWKSIGDLVAYVRANPGRLRIGTTSPGAAWWIGVQMFKQAAGLNMIDIPYAEGAAPMLKALAGREIDVASTSAAEAASLVQSGELRMLAVMADERLAAFPDVPTLKEVGIDVSFGTWRGLMVPLGTPEERVQALAKAAEGVVRDPEFIRFMNENLFGIRYLDADGFAAFMDAQYEAFKRLHASLQN